MKKSFWRLVLKAGLMVGASAAVSLAFWSPLAKKERAHIENVTKLSARSLQADIADDWEPRILAQMRLASLLSSEQDLTGKGNDHARFFVTHTAGYLAVRWMDPSYRVRWLVTNPEGEPYRRVLLTTDAPLRNLLAGLEKRGGTEATLGPAFSLGNGKLGQQVIAPVYSSGGLRGFLAAVFDVEKTFETILADHSQLGYGIAVFEGKEEIYRLQGSDPENEKKWGQEAELRLPGAVWRVRVWPKRELIGELESSLPQKALITGSVIGLLLFLTIDGWRIARRRSQELRRTHDELELRVHDRTAELRAANRKLEAEIVERARAEESLQELSGRLLQLRDEEQRRIARELHDSTVQLLGALAIDIDKLQRVLPNGDSAKAQKLLAQSSELVERATAEVRTISHLLHPPILDDLGLEAVLPWYATGFSDRSGIQVEVDVAADLGRLPRELELTLFRIVQEALTNIHKHSGSPTATIVVSGTPAQVTLQVDDRGCGIPPGIFQPGVSTRAVVGVGLAGMRERVRQLGGRLEITSGGDGTSIRAILPIDDSQHRPDDQPGEARPGILIPHHENCEETS